MIDLEKQPIASWKAPETVKPITFVQGVNLVSDQKGYWTLGDHQSLNHQTLSSIEEVTFLQPAQEGYVVAAFNKADYTNYAYVMQLDGTPQALTAIEDPTHIYYNTTNGQYYYRTTSLALRSYKPGAAASVLLLEGEAIVDLAQSDNGQFLAFQNKEHLVKVLNIATNDLMTYPTNAPNISRSLIAVTNDGFPLVTAHSVVEKNSTDEKLPTVECWKGQVATTLSPTSSGWAAWSNNHLLILHEGQFLLYEGSSLME